MLNNLSPRERVMAMAILVLVPVCLVPLAGIYAWQSIDEKRDRIRNLESRRGKLELNKRHWQNQERLRRDLQALSLPADKELASSEYRNWLLNVSEHVFGKESVKGVDQTPDTVKSHNGFEVYRESRYTMSAEGTLPQLMTFLEEFYKLDCLHRISALNITPIVNVQTQQPTKRLTLKFTFEALSVGGAEEMRDIRKLAEIEEESLRQHLPDTFAEWKDGVLRRNVFGFPNEAPRLSRVGTKRFVKGEPISVRISARDTDEGDTLVFELEESPLKEARLEHEPGDTSATLTTPDLEVGRHSFVVAVRDDGYPSKIDRQEFEIEIEEPEPEEPEVPEVPFDPATATYITGVVRDISGVEQVFVHVKPTGELLKLSVGDAFDVGSVTGVVVLISEGKAIIEIEGEEREFRPGQRLKELGSSTVRRRGRR